MIQLQCEVAFQNDTISPSYGICSARPYWESGLISRTLYTACYNVASFKFPHYYIDLYYTRVNSFGGHSGWSHIIIDQCCRYSLSSDLWCLYSWSSDFSQHPKRLFMDLLHGFGKHFERPHINCWSVSPIMYGPVTSDFSHYL